MAMRQISVTGNRQRGITLVEMLVVMLVIGLTTSVVILTLRPEKSVEEKSAIELATSLQRASQLAIINNEMMGAAYSDNEILLLAFNGEAWVELKRQPLVRDESTEQVEVIFEPLARLRPGTAGINTTSLGAVVNFLSVEETTPQLIFYPTGRATEGEFIISAGEVPWGVLIQSDSTIRVESLHDGA